MSLRTSVPTASASLIALTLLAGTALTPAAAIATPITYTFAGIGAGSLGSQSFTNAAFSITVTGDTSNVTLRTVPGSNNTFWTVPGSSSITVAGIGSANITIPTRVLNNGVIVGWSRGPDSFDILDIVVPGVTDYALNTNFGPAPGSSPFFGFGAGAVTSTLGNFSLTSASNITFQAVVPAPGAAGVLAMGGLLAARRRRAVRGG